MDKIKIISVDFQNDFTSKGGDSYKPRQSVDFVKNILVPYLREKNIKIAEIVSDYRAPRIGKGKGSCWPGTWGYESQIPEDVKHKDIWIKCMNSPVWTRKNAGVPNVTPGTQYQDPDNFNKWLDRVVGKHDELDYVVLIGLTADCCVLCTAQELNWRGYKVKILEQGVDTALGTLEERKQILYNPPLRKWAEPISWETLKDKL